MSAQAGSSFVKEASIQALHQEGSLLQSSPFFSSSVSFIFPQIVILSFRAFVLRCARDCSTTEVSGRVSIAKLAVAISKYKHWIFLKVLGRFSHSMGFCL